MKTIKRFSNRIALIFAMLIFFQGCTVYKSQNLTLDEAAAKYNKVKLYENNGETKKYRNISKIDNEYFGTKKIKGELIKIPIEKENIEKAQIENKAGTGIINLFAFIGGLFVALIVGVVISGECCY